MVKVSDISLVDPYIWPVMRGEGRPDRRDVIGWDLESYRGACTIIAAGDGKSSTVESADELFSFLLNHVRRYSKTLNFFFNLEHDTNAMLKLLPLDKIDAVRDRGECTYLGVRFQVIPRKKTTLTFQVGERNLKISFYDIFQFYQIGKLEQTHAEVFPDRPYKKALSAAGGIRYEDATPATVQYCLDDAVACQELARHFVTLVRRYFNVKSYYSGASLGKALMRKNLWAESYRFRPSPIMDAGLRAYSGARIETLVRGYIGEENRCGRFDKAYLMDISSAYPWAMSQLWDMEGRVSHEPRYEPEAKHSFYRIDVSIPEEERIGPLGILFRHQRVYPVGVLKDLPVCKRELEVLIKYGFRFEIRKAIHILGRVRHHPFSYMREIYEERMRLKREKNPLQLPLKTALNASYGALIQTVPYHVDVDAGDEDASWEFDGSRVLINTPQATRYRAGAFFQPVWATETTAEVRCKIYEDSHDMGEHILFYATDCIASDRPLDLDYSPGLGNYDQKGPLEGLILGCGLYTLRSPGCIDVSKYKMGGRGFGRSMDLYPIFEDCADKDVYSLLRRGPKKLKETRRHPEEFNVFREDAGIVDYRRLSVNFDMKRVWDELPRTFGELGSRAIDSSAHLAPLTSFS